jgi:RNA polymerase sigma factor FliA
MQKNAEYPSSDTAATLSVGHAESLLWRDWIDRRDPAAREQLLAMHLPYARVVAATFYGRRTHDEVEFDDYHQLASMGLLESFDRYDPSLGAQFRTFAARRMQGAILNGLVRLTEKNQQIAIQGELRRERVKAAKMAALEKIDPALATEGDAELASKVTDPKQFLFSFLAEVGMSLALGVMLEGTGMIDAESFDSDASEVSAEVSYFQKTETQRLQQTLAGLLKRLTEQERTVIRYHYLQDTPFDEIGKMLGVKRSRVSQIHQQALRSLRLGLTRQACDVLA